MIYFTDKISLWFVQNNLIASHNLDVFKYCLYRVLSKICFYTSVFIVSIVLFRDNLLQSVTFITTLMLLRTRTGGYHLNNADLCMVCSILLYIAGVYTSEYMVSNFSNSLLLILSLSSLMAIAKLAPINHPNLRLSKKEYSAMKVIVYRICICLSLVIVLLFILKLDIFYYTCCAIIVDIILIIAAKIAKQELKIK